MFNNPKRVQLALFYFDPTDLFKFGHVSVVAVQFQNRFG